MANKTKVYVVEKHYDCEGFSIVGIFSTKKEAQKAEKETKGGDMTNISEWVLGESEN